MKIVIFGLSITSSWGNGHATTYRGLVKALSRRGHEVLFLERDCPWYAENRDLAKPSFCRTVLYRERRELERFTDEVTAADCVIVGSYVPEGAEIGAWVTRIAQAVTAFYDIDTPVTLARLASHQCEYLTPELVSCYDLYLSFTGGPTLTLLEQEFGAARACAFYCAVDPEEYYPEQSPVCWDLGYLGTYSPDRQPALKRLLIDPAARLEEKRFVVAGPQYPARIRWPKNVQRMEHLSPRQHRAFYNAQRFTLNVTRADMIRAGWSPSVRLFEAAACAVPIITDSWTGLDSFFQVGSEILVAKSSKEVCAILRGMPVEERNAVARRARQRVLEEHTAEHRAAELEALLGQEKATPAQPPNREPLEVHS